MGGGSKKFLMKGNNSIGERSDEDLVLNWTNDKKNRFGGKTAKYITNRDQLLSTDMSKVDFVLGNVLSHYFACARNNNDAHVVFQVFSIRVIWNTDCGLTVTSSRRWRR